MKVVAVGGGTGLSVLLRGLKNTGVDLTAIVAVTDEGGSSGIIREELEMPPPGDVRNNIIALAKDEDLMSRIFSFRFKTNGTLSNHSVGNIILAALTRMTGSFSIAVKLASQILAIKGKVLPVCEELIRLIAIYEDGSEIIGETEIVRQKRKIISIKLNKRVKALDEVINALSDADAIVFGPGSLYTSVITNLLVDNVADTINSNEKAIKIYVANIMTQPGETAGLSLQDHVKELEKYLRSRVDFIIANNLMPPEKLLNSYARELAEPVLSNGDVDERYIFEPLLTIEFELNDTRPKARHNPQLLAKVIMKLLERGS